MNIAKTKYGRVLLSIVLGIGLASIFRKTCKAAGCFNFVSPSASDVTKSVYIHNGSCYKFSPETVDCGTKKHIAIA
jgi:hypothetical protein